MNKRTSITLFVLAVVFLAGGFFLIRWLANPAQSQTLIVGVREGILRRQVRQQAGAYLDAARRGDEAKALELWDLPEASKDAYLTAQLSERRSAVTRQLIDAKLQSRWDLLDVQWWSPNCCESGSGPVPLGDSADGARLRIQVYSQDGTPATYIVDVFDLPGQANWGRPPYWQIRDVYPNDQGPLYWRRLSSLPSTLPPLNPTQAVQPTPTLVPTLPPLPTPTQVSALGATVTGHVIYGYGDHRPVTGLPLRIRQRGSADWETFTDASGAFTLVNVPLGHFDIDDDHLSFQGTVDEQGQSIDLGKLKYPLIHPPEYYWQQAASLADFGQLLEQGLDLPFEVCASDATWTRPGLETQRQRVLDRLPFSQMDGNGFQKFTQAAVLYDTIDVTAQTFQGGLDLDGLGADWMYLTGLWSAARDPIASSNCSYSSTDLEALLNRQTLEVWLFGYRVTRVQILDKAIAVFQQSDLCDPSLRSCTVRPGSHYAVTVEPAPGFQIIRFAGNPGVLAVHIVEAGREVLTLP